MQLNTCNSPKAIEIQCTSCNKQATLKTMRIDTPGQSSQVLSTYSCRTCNIQDNSILPYEDVNVKGAIKIHCNFTDKEDLKRYVCVFQQAVVTFKKDDFVYEYSTSFDVTTVAEILLRNAIEEIAQMWDIKRHGSVYDLKQELSTSSLSLSGSINSLESIQDVESAKVAVDILQDMVSNAGFEMDLYDKSGFSRVSLRSKMLSESFFNDLATFNDNKVKHEWTE